MKDERPRRNNVIRWWAIAAPIVLAPIVLSPGSHAIAADTPKSQPVAAFQAGMADRVAVMYAGKLVELSTVKEMFTNPMHPYAQALISSLPNLENKGVFQGIPGLAPSLLHLPTGCTFHPRCKYAQAICREKSPVQEEIAPNHFVSCHRAREPSS